MAGIIRHALVGLVGGYLLSLLIGTFALTLTTFLGMSIFWALIPDIPILWGDSTWDDKGIMDLFWFHYTIDQNIKEHNFIY